MVQRLRICLPIQGMWVWYLAREPRSHNAMVNQTWVPQQQSLHSTTREKPVYCNWEPIQPKVNSFKNENINIKQKKMPAQTKAGSTPSTAVYTQTPLCAVESLTKACTHTQSFIFREVLKLPINLLNPRILQPLFYPNNWLVIRDQVS